MSLLAEIDKAAIPVGSCAGQAELAFRRGPGQGAAEARPMTPLLAAAAANVDKTQGLASRPVLLFIAVSALSLLPFILLLMTSFVKIAVVLSILKSALGAPQIPPSQVITGLALILTLFVMAPTASACFAPSSPSLGGAPTQIW
jgi:flagellar biosynthesis protein FliP